MSLVKTEIKNDIFYVTLDRAEKKNAFNPEMISELTGIFKNIPNVRAVLLSGEGSSFCAGADLQWMKDMKNYSLEENRRDSEALYAMFKAILHCQLPVVCKAQGHVMGGALGLLAVSDIVIAESQTQFCFSEVKLGLVPAVISPFVIQKTGPRAKRWMLTAEVFSSEIAQDVGLVNMISDSSNLGPATDTLVSRFRKLGPEAVQETKRLLRGLAHWSETEIKKQTTQVIAERRVSSEGQEGLQAFFEQRKPKWLLT
ncbi:MAG: enoyl-CoA hydratase/isomerase family protein [Bdellovibrionales bacterium]|nr:enoyl-CoA hydratase/isomerase family protein [Bdellovibrionales bacterium]